MVRKYERKKPVKYKLPKPKKRRYEHPGRPTKLTEGLARTICKLIRQGNWKKTVAAYCGITAATMLEWVRRGKEVIKDQEKGKDCTAEEQLFARFAADYERALAVSEVRALGALRNFGKTTWQTLAWFLERRFPQRWAKREFQDVTSKGNAFAPQQQLTADEKEVIQEKIVARLAAFQRLATRDNGEAPPSQPSGDEQQLRNGDHIDRWIDR
jgi:hypothetical protein